MLKLALALSFLFLNLYACKGGFESCKLKIKHSSSIINNTVSIPILKNKRLIYSRKTPNKKIVKYDPFLSLYLVEDKNSFKYPFVINMHLSLGKASVNNTLAIEGKIKKHQVGLNRLANFNEVISSPALLTNSCCSLEGIVTINGIIEKEYLQNFLSKKHTVYSDIGIRVKDEQNLIIVKSIDPFMKNNLFKKGDCILEFDDNKMKNSSQFMKKVLFSGVNTSHKVKIKRDKQIISLNIITLLRYGGGLISDTFLEQKGIYFDKNLKINKIKSGYKNYGFKLGDKILRVNNISVKTTTQVRKYISDYDEVVSLLIQRDGFEFFVNIK